MQSYWWILLILFVAARVGYGVVSRKRSQEERTTSSQK
jgi:hypothetical protein